MGKYILCFNKNDDVIEIRKAFYYNIIKYIDEIK